MSGNTLNKNKQERFIEGFKRLADLLNLYEKIQKSFVTEFKSSLI